MRDRNGGLKGSFSSRMERKFGKYAIPNLSLYLVICYGIGYVVELFGGNLIYYLTLNPYLILHGQIWRLFTWILVPPSGSNIFFTLIMLYFYYSIGTTLERTWGAYRYNVYLFSGMLFTVLGSFLLLGGSALLGGFPAVVDYASGMVVPVSQLQESLWHMPDVAYFVRGTFVSFSGFSTYYINMSIFLAFAATFPEMQVLLMFIIPIKVKVLGILYAVLLVFSCVQGGVVTWVVIGASLMNFLLFFFTSRNLIRMSPRQIKRRREYRKQVRQPSKITKHKCAICGRTELDDPNLEFRFCSKCDGNYEYCMDHLFTHEHVKKRS